MPIFYLQDTLHGAVLIFILLADLLESSIREIIILSIINGGNEYVGAVIAIFSFVFIIAVVFGGMVGITITYYCLTKYDKDIFSRVFALCVYCFGSILYYYGDNISDLLGSFGSQLGCSTSCMLHYRIAGTIASGSAVLIFKKYPGFEIQFNELVGFTHSAKVWFSAAEMITLFIIFDALYNTVVAAASEVGQSCNFEDLAVDISFIVILMISGPIIVTVNLLYAIKKMGNRKRFFIFVTYFVVLISLPLYLLANNSQPLDCAFGCHSFGRNETLDAFMCDEVGVTVFRLVLSVLLFIGVIIISFLLFFNRHDSKTKSTA